MNKQTESIDSLIIRQMERIGELEKENAALLKKIKRVATDGLDLLKIKLTIDAARHALESLENALNENDQRKAGAELYNLQRELHLLKTMFTQEEKT